MLGNSPFVEPLLLSVPSRRSEELGPGFVRCAPLTGRTPTHLAPGPRVAILGVAAGGVALPPSPTCGRGCPSVGSACPSTDKRICGCSTSNAAMPRMACAEPSLSAQEPCAKVIGWAVRIVGMAWIATRRIERKRSLER
eukprot:scaffold179433_cov28-Tisochrysis_lutea.AAC.2